jgi:hypothetical protein
MKKISLKDVKNGLKRDEMRMLIGGGCGSSESYSCTSDADCAKICERSQAYCANYVNLPRTCLMCCY